ncbi:unnamed protein product [Pleuronectes platessa]|uniref:Uncharacterized protein n=1 Tax=Pleuronectes platessa TaxID=8262 RepID=A0A9N7TSP0_PLEPL|nr:unnamed protein product [Pleuronectes platessa]
MTLRHLNSSQPEEINPSWTDPSSPVRTAGPSLRKPADGSRLLNVLLTMTDEVTSELHSDKHQSEVIVLPNNSAPPLGAVGGRRRIKASPAHELMRAALWPRSALPRLHRAEMSNKGQRVDLGKREKLLWEKKGDQCGE